MFEKHLIKSLQRRGNNFEAQNLSGLPKYSHKITYPHASCPELPSHRTCAKTRSLRWLSKTGALG
eukprot:6191165-Pleurochrysis_carterae.AAC.4